jgi:hypothetical protein
MGSNGTTRVFPVLDGTEALTMLRGPDAEKEAEECASCGNLPGAKPFSSTRRIEKDATIS